MTLHVRLITCVLVAVLTFPITDFAQSTVSADAQWESLRRVAAGNNVRIEMKNGKTIKAKAQSASASALAVMNGRQPVQLDRGDIDKVYFTGASRGKSVLLGAGIGAGGGAITGAALGGDGGFISGGAVVAIFAGLGIITGTVVGLITGVGRHKNELVYDSHPGK